MKHFRSGAARISLAAALAAMVAGSAFGDEQLLMPYACRVQGGEVRLLPSADTFYRIYGTRTKQVFTACAPDNPNRCRNWLLHRFDLDCGGVRVGWLKVVEAAARADRLRARVDAGRMSLAMDPYWTVAREGPVYGRRWWRQPRLDGPYGEPGFAARRRGADIVMLPPGYAPVLSTGARFLAGPEPEIARAAPPELLPPPVKKPELARGAPPKEQPAKEASLPVAGARSGESTTSSASSASSAAGASSTSAPSAAVIPPGSTVTATIINKPGAPTTVASPPPASGPNAQPSPPAAPSATEKPSAPGEIATGSLQDADPAADGRRGHLAVAGAATAALLLATSLFFWSRRGRVPVADLARDPARVSLGGLGRTGGLTLRGATQPAAGPDAAVLPLAAMASPPIEPTEPLSMPTNMAEALAVLGASSGAAPEVVKKIVDGLRQSWHPDLARSEADRLYREQRMAQINVAWDILSGRQSAA